MQAGDVSAIWEIKLALNFKLKQCIEHGELKIY